MLTHTLSLRTGFQHVALSQPLAIDIGDVIGVTHSPLLAWVTAAAPIVAAAVPSVGGAIRLLSPNTTAPWIAAHAIVPTLATFTVNASGASCQKRD